VKDLSDSPLGSFAPWIVFWVVAGSRSTWEYGVIAAAIVGIILIIPTIESHRVKMLDVATIAFFGALAIAGAIISPHDGDWLDRWSNTLSSGVLASLVILTLPFMPFTEQYARESTPPEIWHTPAFRRTNLVLTAVWGAAFAATAVLGAIAVEAPSSSDWTNWVLPICIIVAAFKFTNWYPAQVRRRAGQGRDPGDLGPGTSGATASMR
jgi:hypothetical protein